ncbi:hypothetical protein [Microbacterium indicum]|uniref:hypothetical protein n=1 Tax=Microbacterium indicum TaxID=358100 RepID=UPI0003F4BE87|nr:hypothetical protein [Microbacterium indicum]
MSDTPYARGFYRPAPVEQVEWSFPLDHGGIVFDDPVPETRAAMALMDAVDPVFVTGLHNAELGGVYFYVSDDLTPAIEDLHGVTAALGLPLDRGEPEFAGVEPLADAVFPALSAHAMIDALVEMGVDPAQHVTAGGTADYAERFGASMLVAELPYWAHADADDVTESREKYRDVLARSADDLRGLADVLDAALDVAGPDLGIESQLRRAAVAFAGGMRANAEEAAARALDPASDRPATVAEVFSNADNVRMFRLRFGSMLARTLHVEIAAGTASPAVRSAARDLDVVLEGWYAEAAERQAELETIPIERLVGVQLGAVLSAARVAVSRRRGESV